MYHSRFASFASYTADDVAAFSHLRGPTRKVERGDVLRQQGDSLPDVYRLVQGWLVCSMATAEGGRQITKVHLPGDLVGMPSLAASESAETVAALTDAVVEIVPLEAFSRVCREHPRFVMLLFMWSQEERIRLMHQLTLVGQMRGERRMAAFVMSIYHRLRLNDPNMALRFALPMTQQDFGDATGMSVVHANRSIKALRQRGLVAIQDGFVTISDLAALQTFAGTPPLQARYELDIGISSVGRQVGHRRNLTRIKPAAIVQ
jgi:CRP/FNR family transcriptional regulator